jgi:hypothetical protein
VGKSGVGLIEGEIAIQPDVNLQNTEGCGDRCKRKIKENRQCGLMLLEQRLQLTPWEGSSPSHHINYP